MQKLFLSLFFSTILLVTGCFSDADSADNSSIADLDTLEFVDGQFSSNGFVQFNSFKRISGLNSKIIANNGKSSIELESKIDIIHNEFSNVYSYFVSFDDNANNSDSIELELQKDRGNHRSFNFDLTEADNTNNLLDVREPGESASFHFANSGFVGCDVSTQPNILVRFLVPINPLDYEIKMVSVTDGTEIPISVEFTKNPTLLILINQSLKSNELYKIVCETKDSEQRFEVLFLTKALNVIFETLTLQDKYLELVTSNFMLGLSANLEVNKIVEFNDLVDSATQGAYNFPGVYNFLILTSDKTLKLIEDFNLTMIDGKPGMSSIAGMISADIDNDGLDELLVYNNFGRVEVYKITSKLELVLFDKYELYRPSDILTSLSIADVDNNGYYDLIVGYASGVVSCLYRSEYESDYQHKSIAIHEAPIHSISLSDFNRDSLLDMAFLDKAGILSVHINRFSSWQKLYVSEVNDLSKFYIHDLNHDGFDDIITSSNSGKLVYFDNHMNSFDASVLNTDNQYFDDICFASGFTQNNIYEVMIYRPVVNLIRTFSLEGYFQNVELYANKNKVVEIEPSKLEMNSLPSRIVSADFNNDRLLDILVVSEDSLTVYLQRYDNSTESNAFLRKYNMSSIAPENIVITDLKGDSNKELIFSESNRLIIVTTENYLDETLEIELNPDEQIVDFTYFKHRTLDYLAILTTENFIVGLLEYDDSSNTYAFSIIQTQQVTGNEIEIIDFNEDKLPDALIRTDNQSSLMFSQLPNEDLTFFQHVVDFPMLYIMNNGNQRNTEIASVTENQIQLYEYSDQGIFIDKLSIPQTTDISTQTRIIKNDIDHDGNEDIILIRTYASKLSIDVLTFDSVEHYKHNTTISDKLTELVNTNNLRYVGLVDLDSDSWVDIVFSDVNQKLFTLKVK